MSKKARLAGGSVWDVPEVLDSVQQLAGGANQKFRVNKELRDSYACPDRSHCTRLLPNEQCVFPELQQDGCCCWTPGQPVTGFVLVCAMLIVLIPAQHRSRQAVWTLHKIWQSGHDEFPRVQHTSSSRITDWLTGRDPDRVPLDAARQFVVDRLGGGNLMNLSAAQSIEVLRLYSQTKSLAADQADITFNVPADLVLQMCQIFTSRPEYSDLRNLSMVVSTTGLTQTMAAACCAVAQDRDTLTVASLFVNQDELTWSARDVAPVQGCRMHIDVMSPQILLGVHVQGQEAVLPLEALCEQLRLSDPVLRTFTLYQTLHAPLMDPVFRAKTEEIIDFLQQLRPSTWTPGVQKPPDFQFCELSLMVNTIMFKSIYMACPHSLYRPYKCLRYSLRINPTSHCRFSCELIDIPIPHMYLRRGPKPDYIEYSSAQFSRSVACAEAQTDSMYNVPNEYLTDIWFMSAREHTAAAV